MPHRKILERRMSSRSKVWFPLLGNRKYIALTVYSHSVLAVAIRTSFTEDKTSALLSSEICIMHLQHNKSLRVGDLLN